MTELKDALLHARDSNDFGQLLALVPYARFMGFQVTVVDGDLRVTMPYAEHLIGNGSVDALHGGTLGAMMESAAIFKLLWSADTVRVPKTINITVEFLQKAERGKDTFARAEFIRHGRRVANVRTFCWQDDPNKLVAAANAHFLLTPE
ncbi:MAG: PaaI family thioesterase [Polyangiales bacterium]|nr:PaaI family thioesterase [Myxococcales bacterium]MCB9661921.1 PaaI family thioesterase [Sandaracinaceae bacterium]